MLPQDTIPRVERSILENHTAAGAGEDFDLDWIGRSTGRAERRQVVVLAIGFAPVGAADPEEIVELLARRSSLVSRIIARYGGTIGRVDPDQQIASWGWPAASEADTRLAVAAALEIVGDGTSTTRCGVDAGIAITPDGEYNQTGIGVVGEMLGEATALQRLADGGSVLISETLRVLIGGAFECARDNDGGGVAKSWRVVRRLPAPGGNRVPAAWELVGRSRELAAALDCWRSAVSGPAQALCLEGDAGVGKSALVGRLERTARSEGGAVVAVHCLPEMQYLPLEPARRLFDGLLTATLEPGYRHGVSPGEHNGSLGREGRSPGALADAIDSLITPLVAIGPLLLVVEDLHWADAGSLTVLSCLRGHLAGRHRVMLVTTRRPTTAKPDSPAGTDPRHILPSDFLPSVFLQGDILQIDRLTAQQIERVLAGDQASGGLAPEIRQRIAEHADGIPHHAIELARLCAEMPDSEAHHRLLSRPNRLNAGLANRLDALAGLKPLAQAAAVLGRRFDCTVLAVMLHMDARTLTERLQMLVGLGILERGAERQAQSYRFTQALLWSQAYGSVLKVRRRQIHARAAATLTLDFALLAAAAPEAVAHHYKKAGDAGNAFTWWCKAAHVAARLGSPATAIAHVSQALAAKAGAPDVCNAFAEAELLSLLGAQLGALRGNDSRETVAAYERALQLIETLPARPQELGFDIGWGLVAIQLVRGNVRDAVTMSGRLLEQARESNRDDAMLLALRMHGTARLLSGRVVEAVELLSHAFQYYDPAAHAGLRVRYVSDPGAVALAHLSSAQALAGLADASRATRVRALKLTDSIAHAHTSANVLGVLSLAAVHLDEAGIAAALARASHAIAWEHGHAYWVARADLIVAWEQGRRFPQRGFAPMRAAVERYHETGAGRASVLAHCLAADIANRTGEHDAALAMLEPVSANGETHGEWLYAPEVLRLRALAMARMSAQNVAEAGRLLDEAERLANAQGAPDLAARAVRTRADLVRIAAKPVGRQRNAVCRTG